MGAGFYEGYLDLPAPDKEGDDLCRLQGHIRAEECLWVSATFRVTDQTQRIVAGVLPGRYQIAMSEVISSSLSCLWPYQAETQIRCQTVAGFARSVLSLGKGAPFCAGRPMLCRDRSGGISKRLASSRNLLISVARCLTACTKSWVPKLLSATKTHWRSGSHRHSCMIPCRAQSVSKLCRRPCLVFVRSEGASSGRAFTTPAHGTGANTIKLSHRKPLALTKWPWLERTGSRRYHAL